MKTILLYLILFFVCTGQEISFAASGGLQPAGAYWGVDKSTPEQTLQAVVDTIQERDYLSLYALVSMDAVRSLMKNVMRQSPEVCGIEMRIADIVTSEYGRRYGKIAVFERFFQMSSSMQGSWVNYVENCNDLVLSSKRVEKTPSNEDVTAEIKCGKYSFIFKQAKDGWFLDNVKMDVPFDHLKKDAASNYLQPGGAYWAVDRSTPEQALQAVINTIQERDYLSLYALVSMDVVRSLNKYIIPSSPEVWGIEMNLVDILFSEYGQRYGKIAVFERFFQMSSLIQDSWVSYMENCKGLVLSSKRVEKTPSSEDKDEDVIAEIQCGKYLFVFKQAKDGWFLDDVKMDNTGWRK